MSECVYHGLILGSWNVYAGVYIYITSTASRLPGILNCIVFIQLIIV